MLFFKGLELVIDWTWGAGLATEFAGGGPSAEEPPASAGEIRD